MNGFVDCIHQVAMAGNSHRGKHQEQKSAYYVEVHEGEELLLTLL